MRLLVVYLVILLQGASFSWKMQGVKGDLLSPVLGGVCDSMVCGKGTCKVDQSSRFGFECECDPGWNRFWPGDQFAFLPCLIPQCVYDSVCYNDSIAQTSAPFPAIPRTSLFDHNRVKTTVDMTRALHEAKLLSCLWSFCGEGSCIKMSDFEHHCGCKEGYTNFLNMPNLPCFKECKVKADCPLLGFTISNTTTSSPPSHLEQSGSGSAITTKLSLQWIYTWIILLVVLQQQIMYS